MRRLSDLMYGNVVTITEYENGYTVSKNALYSLLIGDGAVCYVDLPGDKKAVMVSPHSMSIGKEGSRLTVWWQDYKILMKTVINDEAEAERVCKAEAERFAERIAGKNDQIVRRQVNE